MTRFINKLLSAGYLLFTIICIIGIAQAATPVGGENPENDLVFIISADHTTWTVDDSGGADYMRIQDAINASNPGDTIEVYSGTYYENVNVNKQLIIRGIDTGEGKSEVNASTGGSAITLNAGNSTLEGFMVIEANYPYTGILVSSNNNQIINNSVSRSSEGIRLSFSSDNILTGNDVNISVGDVIILENSINNTIIGNKAVSKNISHYQESIELYYSNNNYIRNNDFISGIYLNDSNNNTIEGNNATENPNCGIEIRYSNDNTLISNIVNSLYGIKLWHSNNNSIQENYVSGEVNGIELMYSDNNTLVGNNAKNSFFDDGYGIFLYRSKNNMLIRNKVTSNIYGIYLHYSTNNTLIDNIASNNDYSGIYQYFSHNNALISNTASNNSHSGIHLFASEEGTLIGNTVSNNSVNGFYLSNSNNNTLIDNVALNNSEGGILLWVSQYNTLIGNTVLNNIFGISLYSSSNNTIYNNLLKNNNNVNFLYGTITNNTWNTTKAARINIIGGPYIGGNFWAHPNSTGFSQTCLDTNKDGLCEYEYILAENNIDYLPLANVSDLEPPKSITYLQNKSYALNQINFTWTNPLDPDYHHVMLFLNGTFLLNITAPQNYYSVTGLTPDTEYELGTHTVDRSGNINETWVNKTASTAPISGTTYSISLASGWNLISVPLMPKDTGIASVLSPINGNYSIVLVYNATDTEDHWKKYDPSAPFGNDLTTMEAGKGYWIMMNSDDTFTINGNVPGSTDIILKVGWNLVGYNSLNPQPITYALSSINGNYSIIWAYNASNASDH